MTEEIIDVTEETAIAVQETELAKPELIDTSTIIANIKAEKEIRVALTEHLMEALVPKVDYYSIHKGGKNSLGKSGAEKVCFMFNLVPKYVILEKTVNNDRAEYELRCDMYNKITGKFAGSGVGCASSKEDKVTASMMKQGIKNVESVANNMLKIAKKRAYVDATLSSTMISFMFTQDLEDGYVGYGSPDTPKKGSKGKGKYPSNREYWDKYDWTKVKPNIKPPSPGFDKDKNKPKPAMETLKVYFYAMDVFNKNKQQAQDFMSSISSKKTYEMTYDEIRVVVNALMKTEDDILKGIEDTEKEGKEMTEKFEQEVLGDN